MKHLIKRWLTEAIKEQRRPFSVYQDVNGEREILTGLTEINTEFVPRAGEYINLLQGNVMYSYQVIEVNHIYHHSTSEFQDGNIVVKLKSAVRIE